MSEHPLFKVDGAGTLRLKTPETTLDYERVVSDDQDDLQLLNSYEIVLCHYPQLSSSLVPRGDVTFTLNVTNVNEAPFVGFRRINDPTTFDFELDSREVLKRLAIYDPDDVVGQNSTNLRYRLSDDRFYLEEYNPDFLNRIVPFDLMGKHFNFKIKEGASFTPGETVGLTITVTELQKEGAAATTTANINAFNSQEAGTVGLSGTPLALKITIQPAASGQNAGETPGYRPLDYDPDPNPLPDDNLGPPPLDIS